MLKLTFANKLILTIVGIEIVFITMRASLDYSTMHTLSDELVKEKVQTSTLLFSTMIAPSLVLNDLASLDQNIHEFLSADNITSVKIIDKENRILANDSKAKEINFDTLRQDHNDLISTNGRIFKVSTLPVKFEGETVGKIEVVFELTEAYSLMDSNKPLQQLFILLEIIISALVVFLIVRKLTQKLSHLSIMASRVLPQSHHPVEKSNKSSDEITELFDAFIIMQKRISENTATLVHAKEEAERLTNIKAEFLATMSHEIRTPMNGVLGMIELLERTKLDSKQAHYAHIAHSSASSLLGLINDILDFSKVDAGKMKLEILQFNLIMELEDFVESIAFKAKEKHLELALDTSHVTIQNIVTDPGRLRQILTNLVANAIKFTDSGKISINVNIQNVDETHARLYISVMDTGIGIPQSSFDGLFSMFTQVDSSTTRKYGGTGLGLSIVKKLCELMGGSVSITSEVGRGSVFTFDILVGIGEDEAVVIQDKAGRDLVTVDDITFQNISWPSSTRILLVEDNATNQLVAQGILESIGLHCDIAANGLEAVEAIRVSNNTLPYTIVLMDCQMPEMDGYDATKAIRSGQAGEENKHLPIIAMTANAMQSDREKCSNAGMDDYITKPINLSHLKSVLVKWILK